jgi:hypothetical protein
MPATVEGSLEVQLYFYRMDKPSPRVRYRESVAQRFLLLRRSRLGPEFRRSQPQNSGKSVGWWMRTLHLEGLFGHQ